VKSTAPDRARAPLAWITSVVKTGSRIEMFAAVGDVSRLKAITVADVRGLFNEARIRKNVSPAFLSQLARLIEHEQFKKQYRETRGPTMLEDWKKSPELRFARTVGAAKRRLRKSNPALAAQYGYLDTIGPPQPVEKTFWHQTARSFVEVYIALIEPNTGRSKDGPAVRFSRAALGKIGVHVSAIAIEKMLRENRRSQRPLPNSAEKK
jgi:hypothetical protein